MKFFKFNRADGNVDVNDSRILLIKEFKALLENKRNISKEDKKGELKLRAQKEFAFMFLYIDWESPYFKFPEEDKKSAAIDDCGLTEKELEDETFKEACKKYNDLQDKNQEIRLLRACLTTIDKIIYYLEDVDINERDSDTGKPIFKTKDIIAEIKGAKDLITSIRDLEAKVKEGLQEDSAIRGDVELGFFD